MSEEQVEETIEDAPKPGRPPGVKCYVTVSNILTSAGRKFHGSYVYLPKEEAERLKGIGAVQ